MKASVPARTLVPPLRDIIRRADPKLPISDVRTMADVVQLQTAPRTAQIRVLGAFAAIALLLAGIGIHGVLSFAVSQRTREIGVRMALGAQPGDVLGMIVKRGLWLALAGIVPGVAIAYAVGRAFEAMLAGVQPNDGPTFGVAIALAVVMTIAGTLVPDAARAACESDYRAAGGVRDARAKVGRRDEGRRTKVERRHQRPSSSVHRLPPCIRQLPAPGAAEKPHAVQLSKLRHVSHRFTQCHLALADRSVGEHVRAPPRPNAPGSASAVRDRS